MPKNFYDDTSTGNETDLDKDFEVERAQNKKRVKTARDRLNSLVGLQGRNSVDDFDTASNDRKVIADSLKKESAIAKGSHIEEVAQRVLFRISEISCHRGKHGKPLTAVVVGSDGSVYTADKSSRIVKWNPGMSYSKELVLNRRTVVLCLAITEDASRLVSGHLDGSIGIWDCCTGTLLHTLSQHKGAIYSLVFQTKNSPATNQEERSTSFTQHGTLYSSSQDRTVKLWVIDDTPALLDTLYGHQDAVPFVDTISREQCISVGGRDGTVRLWSIAEETQLVYRPMQESGMQEMLAMMDENNWLTASSCIGEPDRQPCISLWARYKKKPLAVVPTNSPITSLTALRFSDLVLTGHVDGSLRAWRADIKNRVIEAVNVEPINLHGIVNNIFISKDAIYAACGCEPRLGRWVTQSGGSQANRLFRIPFGHA